MISLLKQWFAERAGRAQAVHEIKHLAGGHFSPAQLAQSDPRLQEAGGRTPFARAYAGRWYDEGYRHAMAGRSPVFENFDYDCGWIDGMRKRHQEGFRHERLEREFERLVCLHFSEDLWPSFGIRHEA